MAGAGGTETRPAAGVRARGRRALGAGVKGSGGIGCRGRPGYAAESAGGRGFVGCGGTESAPCAAIGAIAASESRSLWSRHSQIFLRSS
jgi:hypothetical protein